MTVRDKLIEYRVLAQYYLWLAFTTTSCVVEEDRHKATVLVLETMNRGTA